MWSRGGHSTALERAQALLSGRRPAKTRALVETYDEDRNSAAKTPRTTVSGDGSAALPTRKSPFLGLSDLSSSASSGTQHGDSTPGSAAAAGERTGGEGDLAPPSSGGGRSRFLKKAAPPAASSKYPAFSKSQQPPQPSHVSSAQRSSQRAALSRLASIEDPSRVQTPARSQTSDASTSDPGVSPPPPRHDASALLSSADDDLGLKGKRFLKKTTGSAAANTDPRVGFQTPTDTAPPPGGTGRAAAPMSSARSGAAEPIGAAGRGASLDSDEEDMRRLLGDSPDWMETSGVSGTSSKKTAVKPLGRSSQKISPTPVGSSSIRRLPRSSPPLQGSPLHFSNSSTCVGAHRSPPPLIRSASAALSLSPSPPYASPSSPAGVLPRSLSSSSLSDYNEAVRSLEELFSVGPEEEAPSEASDASSDDFKINVMTLDDLAPLSLRLAEAPLGKQQKKTKPSKHKSKTPPLRTLISDQQLPGQQEEEEIREEEAPNYESDFESESRSEAEPGSASKISERLGGDGEGVSEASRVTDSDRSRGRTGVDEYSSGSFSEDGRRSYAAQSRGSSYSDRDPDWSSSDTVMPSHLSRRSSPRRAVREAAVQTHPDALSYTWSAGMATLGPAVGMTYVDPTPIASHTVSAEAVEALSNYSPAVFALNDMLRQQLTLTRHFIYTNRHMHSSLLHNLGPADYTYTTLEDTQQFIRKHKPPTLTVEEALEQVLQEMRDYHFFDQ